MLTGRQTWFCAVASVAVLAGIFWERSASGLEVSRGEAISQSVYVWQREWNEPVRNSFQEHRGVFSDAIILGAEIGWVKGHPNAVMAAVDYGAIRATGEPVGLALRLGTFAGPFDRTSEDFKLIARVAKEMVREAEKEGVAVSELHLDFDCAESKLEGYREWIAGIKETLPGIAISITVLPSWLDRRSAFAKLIDGVSRYVLQVHSLERPKTANDPVVLCNPAAARRAVAKASRFQKPFLVALPTYSYLLAYDAAGNFAGLGAEGSVPQGKNHALVELRSSPGEMAALVREWSAERPGCLRGIIWYRLPVGSDQWNWPWRTLETVMRGEPPAPLLKEEVRTARAGLHEIFLRNDGSERYRAPSTVRIRWRNNRLASCDALNDFEIKERKSDRIVFNAGALEMAAGTERKIGWIRLKSGEEEVFESKVFGH